MSALEKYIGDEAETNSDPIKRGAAKYWLERRRRVHDFHNKQRAEKLELKKLLETENGVPPDHPKAEKLFDIAWDKGHAYGNGEVRNEYAELVELLTID